VVVDLGETDVLVGQQAQRLGGGLDARRARRDALKQLAQLLLVDGGASSGMCLDYSTERWRRTLRSCAATRCA
jgi:hypothetical protein